MNDRTMSEVVAALSVPDYPRIQESVFVKQYLPMFAANPEKVDGIIYVNTWINVAGSPFQAVDVYNGSEFLYRVPPLLNSDDTMLKNIGRNGSIHETLQEAALKANVIPKLGEHHIRQWLTDRLWLIHPCSSMHMNRSDLRIAEFGDVHLGHPNTRTSHILTALRLAFPDTPATADLDLIILAGDLFDRQLSLPNQEVYAIKQWMLQFLLMCQQHGIVLRVLEGTPSHDWRQSHLWIQVAEIALSIERIDSLGIDMLYIPDEWRTTCADTWADVQAKLLEHGLEQVDYTVMHGGFHHQMPRQLHDKLELHRADNYLSITRRYVFVGHIHHRSQYDRILAAGSFDRLAHGEEGDKGHYRVHVRRDGVDDIEFVVNTYAQRYVTVSVEGLDVDAAKAKIDKAIARLPPQSYVRLRGQRTDLATTLMQSYQLKYHQYQWSVKETGRAPDTVTALVDTRTMLKRITINPTNISELLLTRVRLRNPTLLQHCSTILEEVLNEPV